MPPDGRGRDNPWLPSDCQVYRANRRPRHGHRGLGWTSNSHTGLPIPVFALGGGQADCRPPAILSFRKI